MFWVCAGLVLIGIWVNLTGYSPVFFPAEATDFDHEMFRYVYDIGRVLACVLFILFYRFFERQMPLLSILVPVLMCLGTALLSFANHQTLFSPVLVGCSGSLISGFGYIWVVITFYIVLAKAYRMRTSIIIITVSQVLEQMLAVLLNFWLSYSVQMLICLILPLVIMLAFIFATRRAPHYKGAPALSGRAEKHQIALLIAAGAAVVIIGAVSTVGSWGIARIDYTLQSSLGISLLCNGLACVLLAILSWLTLVRPCDEPLSFRYQTPFLVLIAAFVIAAFGSSLPVGMREASSVILTSVEYYSHVLMWVIAMAAVQSLRFPAYRTMGIGLLVYSALSLVRLFFLESFSSSATSVLVVVAGYALIVVGTMHPRMTDPLAPSSVDTVEQINEQIVEGEPHLPLEMSGAAVTESLRRRCGIIAERFGLSAREQDVLFLLAQGRSKPIIEKRLFLSAGTVKTHILHVYAKMNVHSQQELINLVYGE